MRRLFLLYAAHFWEAHTHKPFNERQRAVINRLFNGFEGNLTSSKWSKLAKCSQNSALRHIDDLVKRGVLVKEPGGGPGTSYALANDG
jgi:Fic family protein